MSFSRQIVVGLTAGVAIGLFLGEYVSPLELVADGFVKLLQMTVLPYVTVSIIVSLGSLDMAEARRLGLRAGVALVVLWVLALGFALLFPLAFPETETASFFSTSLIETPPPFDFVGLYIPSNPFHSLANNVVPAVVLFSVVLGVALIGVDRKAPLVEILGLISTTIARATRFVVRLTPYGVFALAAVAAGTLELEQVERIQMYLVTYMAMSLLIALWVLPGLVAAVTPIPYKDVLGPTRDALITAFIAGDLFIVLPILIESCRTLLSRHHVTDERLPDVIVPASFNFPHTGKLLSLSFILFAGWFSGSPIPATDYPRLAMTGLLTFFGSLNSAVPFLLDLFRIPADTFQLFVATSVINSRFGTLTAAVHTVALALIGSAAIAGSLRLESKRLVRYGLTTLALTVATIGGLQVAFHTLLYREFKGADVVYGMTNLLNNDPSTIVSAAPAAATGHPVLDDVRARGVLRVGFVARRMPFAFLNGRGELVGFDVELAHLLARDIGVKVEFIEFPAGELAGAVSNGTADIGIGGMPLTPRLAMDTLYSEPYLDETLAFIVKDHLRGRFEHWESIAKIRDITIGLPARPYYETQIRARLPEVPLKSFPPNEDPLSERAGFEAVALPAERGSVLTMLNPKWTVVVPQPGVVKIPLAFPLARHDRPWATVIDTWVEMKKRDGTFEALYNHWILGKVSQKDKPRWSLIRDVLHWVK